jgi:hypothetical protein
MRAEERIVVTGKLGRLIAILTEPARVRRFGLAAILATWIPLLAAPLLRWWDFSSFYAAGRLAFSPSVIDVQKVILLQHDLGLPIAPFLYPPAFAILYAPFAALPYNLAGAINLFLMGATYFLALRLGARLFKISGRTALWAGLTWSPAGVCVATGQNDTLILLLFVLGLGTASLSAPTRLAMLFKPQMGLPVVGTLWLRRPRYGTLLLLAGAVIYYTLGVLATGGSWRWPLDWLGAINLDRNLDLVANGWQSLSMPSALAHALGTQFEILGYLAGAILVVASLKVLRRADPLAAFSLALALSVVISPHAYVYDGVLLLPLLALIWTRSPGHPHLALAMIITYTVALLWVAQPLWLIQPLLIAALAWIIYVLRTPRLWAEVPPLSLESARVTFVAGN